MGSIARLGAVAFAILFACATPGWSYPVEVRFEATAPTVLVQDEQGDLVLLDQPSELSARYEFDTSLPTEFDPLSPDTSTLVVAPIALTVELRDLPSSLPDFVPLSYASATLRYTNTLGDPFFDGIAPEDERVLTQITTAFDESTQQVVAGTWNLLISYASGDPTPWDLRVLRMPEGHDTFVVNVRWWDPDRVNLAQPSFAAEYTVTSLTTAIPEAGCCALLCAAGAMWRRRV